MPFRNLLKGLLAAPALLLPASAFAQSEPCQLRFDDNAASIDLHVTDLGFAQNATGEKNIIIINDAGADADPVCPVVVRVSRVSGTPGFPAYQLTAAGLVIQPATSAAAGGPQNQFQTSVPANPAGQTTLLRVSAPTDWGLEAGQLSERLDLSLIDATGAVLDTLALDLLLDIPKTVDVMFVGSTGQGKATSIDLGELSATEVTHSQPFGVRIWSSSAYRFSFTSENGGTLRHELGMDAIPYDLSVEGRPVALGSSAVPLDNLTASQSQGDLYQLRLAVPARRSIAGSYQDRLTVSVSAI